MPSIRVVAGLRLPFVVVGAIHQYVPNPRKRDQPLLLDVSCIASVNGPSISTAKYSFESSSRLAPSYLLRSPLSKNEIQIFVTLP